MIKAFLLLCLVVSTAPAQHVITCPYLANPETIIGYVDSCARFWMKAYEPAYGGFYTNISRQGALAGASVKNTLNQSRDAYGFTRAFQLTGDTTYLRYARYGLEFMYAHAWDSTNGGWYNDISKTGTPTSPGAPKTAYLQHYAMLGIAASFEATRDTSDWRRLMSSYAYNESHLWDVNEASYGYYDYVQANGTNPADKSFNATVDAITTHVLHLYLMTGEERYKIRLKQLAENMVNYLVASVPQQAIGFAEKYNSAWQPKSNETMTIMGHVLKTAWCLGRIYQLEKDPLYLFAAEDLVQIVLDKGYDHQNGGPYKDYDRTTGQMLMWGITDTAKAWWQMEQAVTAGLMLYGITGKEKYLEMADESLDFFMKYFVDRVYGEVFENTNKYGGMIPAWGTTKGNSGKAAYHSIETGYYTYLYGMLLVKKEPATLYYRFSQENRDRVLAMKPIGVPESSLRISSVMRNGAPYTQFDGSRLELNLPQGTEGIFAVTYEPTTPTDVAADGTPAVPAQYELHQNYPNPFNPTTDLRFTICPPIRSGDFAPAGLSNLSRSSQGAERDFASLSNTQWVTLKVYNILGKEVATLVNEMREPGSYSVSWDAGNMPSGVYYYRLTAGEFTDVKKMALVR